MGKSKGNKNYAYQEHDDDIDRMGRGSFANMPEKAMIKPYGKAATFRDGNAENFVDTLKHTSKIAENQK